MHYMSQPLSFRWDEEFVARIDEARGLIPRSTFIRAAVEKEMESPRVVLHALRASDRGSRSVSRTHHPKCACLLCKPLKGKR